MKNKGCLPAGLFCVLCVTIVFGAASMADSPPEIAKRVSPSVVLLVMENAKGESLAMGSGFVVREGVVATNRHVTEGAVQGHAKLADQKVTFVVAGIVAIDSARDLVLLAIDGLKAAPLPIGDSNMVQVGDDVYVVGNPQGLESTFSSGIVSSIRKFGNEKLLQITAPISPGSSGGPVVNQKGEVVGVAVGTIEEGQNLNFAIPSIHLSALLAQEGGMKPLISVPPIVKMSAEVKSLLEAANQGDAKAMYELGERYGAGDGVVQDGLEGLKWFCKAARAGHPRSMLLIGEGYRSFRVPPDYEEALKWLRRAAEVGETDAMCNIGQMYAEGEGVQKDQAEAARWFRKSVDGGNARAMLVLGICYQRGKGVPRDDDESAQLLRRAADGGNTAAFFEVGMVYSMGRGVAKDNSEAVKWFRKAADSGDSFAMYFLGLMYVKGGEGIAKDDRAAVKWFLLAAQAGETGAMSNLGEMYEKGEGVPMNDVEAYAWYSTAAAFDASARTRYGLRGVPAARDQVAEKLTPQAKLDGQKRALELYEQISTVIESKSP